MFSTILAAITKADQIEHFSSMLQSLGEVAAHLEADYLKDGNLRDAAIDALCQLLQQHKTTNQTKV